jgi:hypothetical protein
MTDGDPRNDDYPEEPPRGDLAPRVREYLDTVGTHLSLGRPPGYEQQIIACYFERSRWLRMRAQWFDMRRKRARWSKHRGR